MVRAWLYSLAGLVGFLVGAYLLLTVGLPLVLPFAIALVVAELIEPIVQFFTWKGKVPRVLAVTGVLVILVGLFTTAVTAAVARLVQEMQGAVTQLPYLFASAMDLADRFADQFGAFHAGLPDTIQEMLGDNLNNLQASLNAHLPGIEKTLGVVSSLPGFVTNLLIALVATFFMSRDRHLIGDFLLSLFPVEWRPKLRKVKDDVWTSAIGFAKAQLMLVSITMVLSMIGLGILGAKYAVLMGFIIGVTDALPVLGPALIYLPWIGYSLVFGNKIFGLKLLMLYAFKVGVRQVLEAKVVSDQIGLHPLTILLSFYLGFQFFGAIGFVAGPLLAILLKALIQSGLLPIFQEERPKS